MSIEPPDHLLVVDLKLLGKAAEYRRALGYGNPKDYSDENAIQFNRCVVGFFHEAVARFYWRRLMKALAARGVLVHATGEGLRYRSLMFLSQVNKSTISHWSKFERPRLSLRDGGPGWPPPQGKRFIPMLNQFSVPMALRGISFAEFGIQNGWFATWYGIIETMMRIRNEMLGAHRKHPLERGITCYELTPEDFQLLYGLIRDGSWLGYGSNRSNHSPKLVRLFDLWFVPYVLLCSVSDSLGDYIRGFSDEQR